MFPKNGWYLACTTDEIDGAPLSLGFVRDGNLMCGDVQSRRIVDQWLTRERAGEAA